MLVATRSFLTGVFVCLLFAPTGISAQQAKNFGKGNNTFVLTEMKLSAKQRRHFRSFKKNVGFFAYFFATSDGETSAYITDMHDLEIARSATEALCTINAKKRGAKCVAYAVALPKSLPGATKHASGLNESGGKALVGEFVRSAKKDKGWAAFSINKLAQWGWATGWSTKSAAKDSAQGFCDSSAVETLAKSSVEIRTWIRTRGLEKCRVVYISEYN